MLQAGKPWVSFCISTYQRPSILQAQLQLLSRQTFIDFEVVVSDNDPAASAKAIVEGMNDQRFRYFHNEKNFGMIPSFNKSIERSTTEFVVLVTDDDPIEAGFLEVFHKLYEQYPGYSMYCGFQRNGKTAREVELIVGDDFLPELLDPDKTLNLLWSSAILRKADVLTIGLIPDYGSPHLADHAFMAAVGSVNGALVMNKMFSSLSSHDANFSKFNFDNYTRGCGRFHAFMEKFFAAHLQKERYRLAVTKHLDHWFMACMFILQKHYAYHGNKEEVKKVQACANDILQFPFMLASKKEYRKKNTIFTIKQFFKFRKA